MIGILISLVLFFGVWYLNLLTIYARLWQGIPTFSSEESDNRCTVSVIVPFRNEAENLPSLIESINQVNSGHHIVDWIFVDDHSEDNGAILLSDQLSERASWTLLKNEGITGKKAAVELAWRDTKSDIIIQTDADCNFGKEWLCTMVNPFITQVTQLVSGPVQYESDKGVWNRIIVLDFIGLIAIGAAHIQWRKPLICNAANMAYRSTLVSDTDLNASKASGDDVFILQSAFRKDSEGIVFQSDSKAMVKTQGPKTFKEFWHQRIRWASKNGEYDLLENRIILTLVWLYNTLILLCFLSMNPAGLLSGFFLITAKLLAEDRFYSAFADYFGISGWFKTIFIGQPFHIVYMAIIPPLSQILRYKWKERIQK